MKMPQLEVKVPRGQRIEVRGASLGICIDPSDISQITRGALQPMKLKIKQSISRLQGEGIPIAKIIVTGKVLKHVKEAMVLAHDEFKAQMGKAESILYSKVENKDENCYQLVYSYHVLSTPVQTGEKVKFEKPPTQAQKIDQLQTAVIHLFGLQERVIGMAEKLVGWSGSKTDVLKSQDELNTSQAVMNNHLIERCNSLYRGLMGCLFLLTALSWCAVMRETGLYSYWTIGLGGLAVALWVYIFIDSMVLPFLRKHVFYRKLHATGMTIKQATDNLVAVAQAGAKATDALQAVINDEDRYLTEIKDDLADPKRLNNCIKVNGKDSPKIIRGKPVRQERQQAHDGFKAQVYVFQDLTEWWVVFDNPAIGATSYEQLCKLKRDYDKGNK